MTKRDLPGIIDINPTRSRMPEKKRHVRVVYRGKGNREVLSISEILTSKQKAYKNIVASCNLHGRIAYTSPLIRDRTVTPERLILLDISGPRYKLIVTKAKE